MSEYLPQDVMMKILSYLPPKTLIRFRIVSKSYHFLISSLYFINLHTNNTLLLNPPATSNQLIVRCYSKSLKSEVYSVHTDNTQFPEDNTIKIEYPFQNDIRFYNRIVDSCNGVLCLLDDQFGDAGDIHLWNPLIMRKLKLPPTTMVWSRSMIVLGFGFDTETHDYKVVKIAYVRGDRGHMFFSPVVDVYSLSRRSWHTVECAIPYYVPEYFWSQAFINGNVHWVAYKRNGRNSKKLENVMMLFDLTLEVFDEMPLPEPLSSELTFNLNALDVHGSLAVVHYDERVWCTSVSIWVMRIYGDASSWSRNYKIDRNGGIGVILGVSQNSDILVSTKIGTLAACNRATQNCGELGILGTKDSFYVGPYRESLVLLAEGVPARQSLPSDEDSDVDDGEDGEIEVDDDSDESEDSDGESSRVRDVEKSEHWMQGTMSQYLTALLRRPYI